MKQHPPCTPRDLSRNHHLQMSQFCSGGEKNSLEHAFGFYSAVIGALASLMASRTVTSHSGSQGKQTTMVPGTLKTSGLALRRQVGTTCPSLTLLFLAAGLVSGQKVHLMISDQDSILGLRESAVRPDAPSAFSQLLSPVMSLDERSYSLLKPGVSSCWLNRVSRVRQVRVSTTARARARVIEYDSRTHHLSPRVSRAARFPSRSEP